MDCSEKDCSVYDDCSDEEYQDRASKCGLFKPLITEKDDGSKVPCSGGLVAMQAEAKLFIDANVWDGENRKGATNDRATFNPDELQELIDDMLEHMSN